MVSFKQISFEERMKIESLIKQGFDYNEISGILKRSSSSMTEEIERNGGYTVYNARNAQERTDTKKREAYSKRAQNGLRSPNPFKTQAPAPSPDILNPIATPTLPQSSYSLEYSLLVAIEELHFSTLRLIKVIEKIDPKEPPSQPCSQADSAR